MKTIGYVIQTEISKNIYGPFKTADKAFKFADLNIGVTGWSVKPLYQGDAK